VPRSQWGRKIRLGRGSLELEISPMRGPAGWDERIEN